jgi:hypothetical protein
MVSDPIDGASELKTAPASYGAGRSRLPAASEVGIEVSILI